MKRKIHASKSLKYVCKKETKVIKLNKCMFFIKKIRPCLNTQSDSIRATLFIATEFCYFFTCIFYAFTCIFYALSPRIVHVKL